MTETFSPEIHVIAKEGADGLLALGIGPNAKFSDGLGLLIKIASGYEPKQLDLIVRQLLGKLDLIPNPSTTEEGVVSTEWHFELAAMPAQA